MADNSDKIKLLNQLYQDGKITEDMFKSNVDKLKTLSQDLRPNNSARASDLSGVIGNL